MDKFEEISSQIIDHIEKRIYDFFDELIQKTGSGIIPEGEKLEIDLPRELAESWFKYDKHLWMQLIILRTKYRGWQDIKLEKRPSSNGEDYVVIFLA